MGCSFYINKLKSQIFHDLKSLSAKTFLIKNLVSFKRRDEIKDENFDIMGVH